MSGFVFRCRHLLWVTAFFAAGYLQASAPHPQLLQKLPAPPLIEPGYAPGPEAEKDVRGLWMEMAEAEKSLRRSPLILDDPLINDYVKKIACQVSHSYCNDLRVYVVRSPAFNASIAPNGLMLVNTGLLVRMTSTDHVAAVLGHEFAHYTQTHSLQLLRNAKRSFAIGTFVSLFGIPGILAVTGVLSFNRQQESEADELGAYYMAAAGYAPEAASRVWQLLEEEEAEALVKRPKGPQFLSTHPKPDDRARRLEAVADRIAGVGHATAEAVAAETSTTEHGTPPGDTRAPLREQSDTDPLLTVLQDRYERPMDEQVQQRDPGRLLTLLARHEAMGIRPTDVAFYRGEALRVSGEPEDVTAAMDAYRQALDTEHPNPRVFRELGYLEYKQGDRQVAEDYFRSFLALEPDASDKEMIEFYLGGGW